MYPFREDRLDIEPVMEFDNVETVKRAVEIDAGVAAVPQATACLSCVRFERLAPIDG